MGCDIHVYLERQDKQGAWHCVWSTDMHYTAIAKSIMPDLSEWDGKDPKARILREISSRSYSLFSILSNVRGESQAHTLDDTLDSSQVMEDGIPQNASSVIAACEDDADLHSIGYITWKDLKAYTQKVAQSTKDADESLVDQYGYNDVADQKKALVWWTNAIGEAINIVVGDTPILKAPIRTFPWDDEDYENPNFAYWQGTSAHETLATIAEGWDGFDPISEDTIRIVVGYDN